ncbi:MAG: HAMP domain-containing sensor histidine kinase [Pseudomonadota bacterium]
MTAKTTRQIVSVSTLLDHRYDHWIMATMLLALGLAVLSDFGSAVSASLLSVHFGLFFLWQPIWQRDQRLDVTSTAFIVVFVGVFVTALNWWLMFFWLILLIGIVAGRSFYTRQARIAYMIALTFLISILLIECVPHIFRIEKINRAVVNTFQLAWVLLPVALAFFPTAITGTRETFPVDFFRGVTIALITALLSISAVLMTYQVAIDYPVALIGSLLAVSFFLLIISWMFSPASGGGLGALWEKSVLNIGTPFEAWLISLAELSDAKPDPDRFLDAAISELTNMTWIEGAKWQLDARSGNDGKEAEYRTELTVADLSVTLFTDRPVGPALLIHCHLLIQLLTQFYTAKVREIEHADQAHMHAVHETGARVTHDIKNLLQSLKTTASALGDEMQDEDQQRNNERLSLLRRQLPIITQRLQLALDKLQRPTASESDMRPARTWWQEVCAARPASNITFHSDIISDENIPADFFESVLDNLLDNFRHKSNSEPEIEASVSFRLEGGLISLTVGDNGAPIADDIANQLFVRPVDSDNGLGIGLYQAFKQAKLAGFHLRLKSNERGNVCFELSNKETI